MTAYIVESLIVSAVLGTFICLIVVSNSRNKIIGWLLGIAISLVFGFGFVGALTLEYNWDTEMWNGGICECGSNYHLVASNKSRMGSETFYYECEECGFVISTNRIMN